MKTLKLVLFFLLIPAATFCDDMGVTQPSLVAKVATLALLSMLPFMIMLLTSFLKIVIVLGLLRNAIGVQQSPPNQAINGMALLMTIYVMAPTGLAMYEKLEPSVGQAPSELFSEETAHFVVANIHKAKQPLKDFLIRNTSKKHIRYFYQLAQKRFPPEYRKYISSSDMLIIVPAYITSQVKAAFEVGVLIYLPFFVIDLVTSNILLAMGMMMLSPLTIALPLKLLLLVMIDGWTLLVQGLVLSFR